MDLFSIIRLLGPLLPAPYGAIIAGALPALEKAGPIIEAALPAIEQLFTIIGTHIEAGLSPEQAVDKAVNNLIAIQQWTPQEEKIWMDRQSALTG
jgi:hypothetical protein